MLGGNLFGPLVRLGVCGHRFPSGFRFSHIGDTRHADPVLRAGLQSPEIFWPLQTRAQSPTGLVRPHRLARDDLRLDLATFLAVPVHWDAGFSFHRRTYWAAMRIDQQRFAE